jgi:hypothetical protein
VAAHGYGSGAFSERAGEQSAAFFPLLPGLLRLVHSTGLSWNASSLLLAAVTSFATCALLWHWAAVRHGGVIAERAVLYFAVSPLAVLAFAGYSELLLAALAIAAWLAADERRWGLAWALAAAAALSRPTGIAVAAFLLVRSPGRARLGALLPVSALLGFELLLWASTGRWDAYLRAQQLGWKRHLTDPGTTFAHTLARLARHGSAGHVTQALYLVGELAAAALLVWLVIRWRSRQRAAAAYLGTQGALLFTGTYLSATLRASLTWFPVFAAGACALVRRPRLHLLFLAASSILMVFNAYAFASGGWVG